MKSIKNILIIAFLLFFSFVMKAQNTDSKDEIIKKLDNQVDYLQHRLDVLEKNIDDIQWYNRVGDVAFIDKCYIYGPPLSKEENPTAMGAGSPVKF